MMKFWFWLFVAFIALFHSLGGGGNWGAVIFLFLIPILFARFIVSIGQLAVGLFKGFIEIF
jgi:hypothetical protein